MLWLPGNWQLQRNSWHAAKLLFVYVVKWLVFTIGLYRLVHEETFACVPLGFLCKCLNMQRWKRPRAVVGILHRMSFQGEQEQQREIPRTFLLGFTRKAYKNKAIEVIFTCVALRFYRSILGRDLGRLKCKVRALNYWLDRDFALVCRTTCLHHV